MIPMTVTFFMKDKDIADQVNWVEMRIPFKAKKRIPEMTAAVSKDISLRKVALQPA